MSISLRLWAAWRAFRKPSLVHDGIELQQVKQNVRTSLDGVLLRADWNSEWPGMYRWDFLTFDQMRHLREIL